MPKMCEPGEVPIERVRLIALEDIERKGHEALHILRGPQTPEAQDALELILQELMELLRVTDNAGEDDDEL